MEPIVVLGIGYGLIAIISSCGLFCLDRATIREHEENRQLRQQLRQMRDQLKDQEIQHLRDKLNQPKNPYY